MKLYTAPFAPNPTKVELYLALREANGSAIEVDRIIVNLLKGEQRSAEHLARNPFGTIPVLELEDGAFLTESLVIIDYLEAQFPEGALLPVDPAERAQAREIERIVDVRLGIPTLAYVHARNSPLGLPPDEARARELLTLLEAPVDYLEDLLSDDREFLTGAQPSVADCTLAAIVNFASVTGDDLFGSRTNLICWKNRFLSQDAVCKALFPGSRRVGSRDLVRG